MEKKFSKIQIAAIKRTAQNVATFVAKKAKIDVKIAALQEEKEALQPLIDAFQGPIKEMTGGYTTEDLVIREVVNTGKIDSKSGKEILQTRFVLKYPETVVPPMEEKADEPVDTYTVQTPMPEHGNDYDQDKEELESRNGADADIDDADADDIWS